jgi:hypothetical protein
MLDAVGDFRSGNFNQDERVELEKLIELLNSNAKNAFARISDRREHSHQIKFLQVE